MNLVGVAVLLGVLSTGAAVLVWIQQANRQDPNAEAAQPLAWFLVVLCLGFVGLLLYWATVDERGPILRPITVEEVDAWRGGRGPE